MAIIPKIRISDQDVIEVIKEMSIEGFPDAEFDIDVDFDEDKELEKYLKVMKSYTRGIDLYQDLMLFLKTRRKMNRCFYLPNVKQFRGSKTKIEVHHAPFTMFDIINTIIRKRWMDQKANGINDNNLLYASHIANEVMKLHYEGKIGLVSLSTTTHELIHSENTPKDLFVPIQHLDFGDPELFFQEYKRYMPDDMIEKYKAVRRLSKSIDNLNDIVPDYLEVQRVYYKLDDNFETQFPKIEEMQALLDKVA